MEWRRTNSSITTDSERVGGVFGGSMDCLYIKEDDIANINMRSAMPLGLCFDLIIIVWQRIVLKWLVVSTQGSVSIRNETERARVRTGDGA